MDVDVRPRVLAVEIGDDEFARLLARFPAAESVPHVGEAAISDFDMLVTRSPEAAFAASELVNVVFVGGSGISPASLASYTRCDEFALSLPGTKSKRYERGDDLPVSVTGLIEGCMAMAIAQARTPNGCPVLRVVGAEVGDVEPWRESLGIDEVSAFVTSSDHGIVAGVVRSYTGRSVWFLPAGVDVVAWTVAACETWSVDDRVRFPPAVDEDWSRDPKWQTPRERSLRDSIAEVDAEHRAALVAYEQRREVLLAELDDAAGEADAGDRRLLTGRGDDLVDAVVAVLRVFGFDVANYDDVTVVGKRLEDLRIVDPERVDDVVIGEVRSYGRGGGKATDLSGKIRRFRERFMLSEGRAPWAAWYIANHTIESAPDRRPRLLASADEDIETFAEHADGLVIDTITLFRVLRAIDDGEVDLRALRAQMMAARGRWQPSLLSAQTKD